MSKNADLPKRLAVAFLLIGVAFAALYAGGFVFWLLVAVGSLLMLAEWANLVGATQRQRLISQYALTVPLAILSPLAAGPGFLALGLIGGAIFFTGATSFKPRLAWGVAYVGLPALALIVLRAEPNGFLLTFWAMALVWACDSGAYFAGRAIGGPKLAPGISPNKTWAGFIGGVAAAGVFAIVLVLLFDLPVALAIATPLLAMLAQVGDLYESHLKRVAGVKDSGNLLPGHGGLLDRLDGLVAVAPVAALLVLLVQ
ncbi:phosphatidate cytidylyltransferase [Sphingomonas sp. AOB5]|uniref:phosphatidate cytidylyltransferase n=1 Tax=Sphingomonas sp. AOB5 TaxID=3034017 RepID=UPI0023F9D7A6|nr:phosphatidate cytidylyltransferase [Sphingomonas sp. AOB5]MDF7773964.1 phosphatidate cytidylyltransferase [Sphingomonas sp. AOB5]